MPYGCLRAVCSSGKEVKRVYFSPKGKRIFFRLFKDGRIGNCPIIRIEDGQLIKGKFYFDSLLFERVGHVAPDAPAGT